MKTKGFTLLETLTVAILGAFVTMGMFAATMVSGQENSKAVESTTVVAKARLSLDHLVRDINASESVIVRYPVVGSSLFTTNEQDTLILRQPKIVNGDRIASQYTIVMYRLISDSTSAGPKVIQRYEAIFDESWSDAEKSVVKFSTPKRVAINVSDMNLNYAAHEHFYRDNNDKKYSLKRFKLRTASAGHKPLIKQQIMVSGSDWVAATKATFSGNFVNFSQEIPAYQVLDAYYTTDVQNAIGADGKSNVSDIAVQLKLKPSWRSTDLNIRSREVAIDTRVSLRNQ